MNVSSSISENGFVRQDFHWICLVFVSEVGGEGVAGGVGEIVRYEYPQIGWVTFGLRSVCSVVFVTVFENRRNGEGLAEISQM